MMMTTTVVARLDESLGMGVRLVMIRQGLRRKTQWREKQAEDAITKFAASDSVRREKIGGESNDFVPI